MFWSSPNEIRDIAIGSNHQTLILGLVLGFLALSVYAVRLHTHLSSIPGPYLSRFTNLKRARWVLTGKSHVILGELHRKYGDCVRLGPDMVSISDPSAIPLLYPMRRGFVKGPFYSVLVPYTNGKSMPGLFQTSDEDVHSMLRRPVTRLFSISNVKSFEPQVDECLKFFLERLDELFVRGHQVCDLSSWLQMFAFDVIGTITYSKRFGFMDENRDINGMMAKIDNHFKSAAPFTQMPLVDKIMNKNPIAAYFRPSTASPMVKIARENILERESIEAELGQEKISKDFLAQYMEAQKKDPNCPPWTVLAWSFSNVTAGSDSTAIILRALFYYLLTNPLSMQRLREELDTAKKDGRLSMSTLCAWDEVWTLPYLDACVKEAIRIHPPFGLPFERIVPEEGMEVCGRWFPGGTVLGMSAWVVNRHKPTFGEDAEDWRPERWLCEAEQRKKMEQAILSFGAGRRACLGKHIAYLEIYKLVPTLLQKYDCEIINPSDFNYQNFWLVPQRGLNVQFRPRETM